MMKNKRYRIRTSLVAGSVVCLLTAVPAGADIPEGYIVIDLGPVAGWSASDGRALNEAGMVVGYSANDASFGPLGTPVIGRATLWHDVDGNNEIDPGEITDLGTLTANNEGDSWAFDVNNSTEIVGRALSDSLCPIFPQEPMIRGFISSGLPPVLAPLPGIEDGIKPPRGLGINNTSPPWLVGDRSTQCGIVLVDCEPLVWRGYSGYSGQSPIYVLAK